MQSFDHPVPRIDGRERDLDDVRRGLEAAGYTTIGLRVLLRRIAGPLVAPGATNAVVVGQSGPPSALAVLARLFLLRDRVAAGDVAVIGPLAASLEALGLLHVGHGEASAAVALEPDGLHLVASDRRPGDVVAPLLDEATPDRHVRSALDIGCGAGRVALRLAAVADRVVALDRDPRAIALCALNASLNGLTNIEVRLDGSPCPRERFGLIVAHAGDRALGSDDRALITSLPAHLESGGAAMALIAWAAIADAAVQRPVPWLESRGVEACILRPGGLADDAAVLLERRYDEVVGRFRIVPLDGQLPPSTQPPSVLWRTSQVTPDGIREVAPGGGRVGSHRGLRR